MEDPSLEAFRREIARPDEAIDLARAAVCVALAEYPDLDIDAQAARLDALAAGARPLVVEARTPLDAVLGIRRHLFDDLGFVGNTADFADPRNSYLNDVLDRHTGIPITLSLVTLEVAWRLGLPLQPVSFPAHFLVKHPGPPEILLDPFHGGRVLDDAGCQALLDAYFAGEVRLDPSHLRPATRGETLFRLLTNLKVLHVARQEPRRALRVIDKMLALRPDSPAEVRDRGYALHALGEIPAAAEELRRFLRLAPGSPDAAQVRATLDALQVLEGLVP